MCNYVLQEKWKTFHFLTEELYRFAVVRELDMLQSLLEQREVLQQEIIAIEDQAFYQQESTRQLIQRTFELNKTVMVLFQGMWEEAARMERAMDVYDTASAGKNNFY